jgi:hypothetical protein
VSEMPSDSQRWAQMTDAKLQRDPSPEAAAEIRRRNARSTVYTSYAAYADAALNPDRTL